MIVILAHLGLAVAEGLGLRFEQAVDQRRFNNTMGPRGR